MTDPDHCAIHKQLTRRVPAIELTRPDPLLDRLDALLLSRVVCAIRFARTVSGGVLVEADCGDRERSAHGIGARDALAQLVQIVEGEL